MVYTVIFRSGKVQCFYIKGVAELYASLNGGFLVSPSVLSEENPSGSKVIQESPLHIFSLDVKLL